MNGIIRSSIYVSSKYEILLFGIRFVVAVIKCHLLSKCHLLLPLISTLPVALGCHAVQVAAVEVVSSDQPLFGSGLLRKHFVIYA